MEGNEVIGAVILFLHENKQDLFVGRIFIDCRYHRNGYGIALMECIENMYATVNEVYLDTPIWNIRTNAFYK